MVEVFSTNWIQNDACMLVPLPSVSIQFPNFFCSLLLFQNELSSCAFLYHIYFCNDVFGYQTNVGYRSRFYCL